MTSTEHEQLDAAASARLLKRILRAKFPHAEFSVRKSSAKHFLDICVEWDFRGTSRQARKRLKDVRTIADQFIGLVCDPEREHPFEIDAVIEFEGQEFRSGAHFVFCLQHHKE